MGEALDTQFDEKCAEPKSGDALKAFIFKVLISCYVFFLFTFSSCNLYDFEVGNSTMTSPVPETLIFYDFPKEI